jgi:hypothetical protein
MKRAGAAAAVVVLVMLSVVNAAHGQGWSADLSAGRLVYDPFAVSIGTNNVTASLRYDTRRDGWVYGAGAVPAGSEGPFWLAGGAGGRVMPAAARTRRVGVGADLGAHGFSFRDRVTNEGGAGGTLDALPFLHVAVGTGFVEPRVGWRGHTLSFAGAREHRGVFESGVRGGYGAALRAEGDARWVYADQAVYPFVGGTVAYDGSRIGVWGHAGKWLAAGLDEHVWAVGSAVTLGVRTTLWGTVRQEARDPLYWNPSRRTWSIGLTQRLGRIPAGPVPVARSGAGIVVVRLPVGDAPSGTVSIAGDFNNWQAVPMQREAADWVARLPLAPGVYNYTFRSAGGEWFVPVSTPGRRDDGFGGYLAVLVVN